MLINDNFSSRTTGCTSRERSALAAARARVGHVAQARELVQVVAQAVQASAHARIAVVVSRCLATVFGNEAYEFKIDFEKKRGKTEAKMLFVRDGLAIEPLRGAGGGAVDVASFALRLACLMLTRPRRRLFLAIDEPCKHLSAEYRPAFRLLLEVLCAELGLQVLMITHSDQLLTGKIVEL